MQYNLIYDAAGFDLGMWMLPAIGVGLTAYFGGLVFKPKLQEVLLPRRGFTGPARGCLLRFFLLFAAIWTVVAIWLATSTYLNFRSASHNCAVISGYVSAFSPMRPAEHTTETFNVADIPFELTGVTRGGFNTTASQGGPIREGLPVRICYVHRRPDGNIILRLETAPQND